MSTKTLVIAAVLCSALAAQGAQAGTVILSGDVNIGNGIDGSSGASVDAGNTQFFKNILGAGTNVLIQEGNLGLGASLVTSDNAISTLYSGLPGVTSTTITFAPVASNLAGVNLFISSEPDTAYNATNLSALAAFLSGGGTALFIGDNGAFAPLLAADGFINSALAVLDPSLSLDGSALDAGYNFATGGHIASDPLTTGITSFEYAYVSGVTGGTDLFFTSNDTPFVTTNTVASTVPVPEPVTLSLFGVGLAGAIAMRRRKKKAA
jgi:PEP-CTERM motif